MVDPDSARVVVTPNMSLTGVAIGAHLEGRFHVPVAVGNDGNLGTLGETWLGSARQARSARGHLGGHRHRRRLRAEGKALAGRPRVGRRDRPHRHADRRPEVRLRKPRLPGGPGQPHAPSSATSARPWPPAAPACWPSCSGGDLSVIRSGAIRRALEAEDPLVTEVVRHASEVLGYACLTVRHLIDPAVIVLGGGVIEACSDFMMPIIENIVGKDRLPGARDGGQVLLSALGDDAVVLGAVALARTLAGRSPFKSASRWRRAIRRSSAPACGEITVGRRRPTAATSTFPSTARRRSAANRSVASTTASRRSSIPRNCRRSAAAARKSSLSAPARRARSSSAEEAQRYLSQRAIRCEVLPTAQAVEAYNGSKQRKAALMHVSC